MVDDEDPRKSSSTIGYEELEVVLVDRASCGIAYSYSGAETALRCVQLFVLEALLRKVHLVTYNTQHLILCYRNVQKPCTGISVGTRVNAALNTV